MAENSEPDHVFVLVGDRVGALPLRRTVTTPAGTMNRMVEAGREMLTVFGCVSVLVSEGGYPVALATLNDDGRPEWDWTVAS